MKRALVFLTSAVVALPLLAWAAAPQEMQHEGMKPKAAEGKAKTATANGKVTAVSADSLTVAGTGGEWTFTVDSKTKVVARGASRKSMAAQDKGQKTTITDFVGVGDTVTVTYHDMGTMKHAANVRVTAKAKPA